MDEQRWLTAHAVADLLSISYDGALRLMKKAGAKKLGALVRIREDVLNAYLDQSPGYGEANSLTEVAAATYESTASQLKALRRKPTAWRGREVPRG